MGIGFVAAVEAVAAGGIDEGCDSDDLALVPAPAVKREAGLVRAYIQEFLLGGIGQHGPDGVFQLVDRDGVQEIGRGRLLGKTLDERFYTSDRAVLLLMY